MFIQHHVVSTLHFRWCRPYVKRWRGSVDRRSWRSLVSVILTVTSKVSTLLSVSLCCKKPTSICSRGPTGIHCSSTTHYTVRIIIYQVFIRNYNCVLYESTTVFFVCTLFGFIVALFSCIISACMLYYCNTVRWAWLDWGLWMTSHPPSVRWHCWLGLQTCKNRRPYNLYCVGADVKPCSIASC